MKKLNTDASTTCPIPDPGPTLESKKQLPERYFSTCLELKINELLTIEDANQQDHDDQHGIKYRLQKPVLANKRKV
jgi:hypothetical protein